MTRADRILERLAAVDRGPPTPGELPDGLPAAEFLRSPAARLVGRAAAADGLILAHYEHRQPVDRGTDEAGWDQGTIPEPKYADFRHDLPIGSFHPGHRAKWSTHEFAHLHVGFAWWPGAPPLAVATAGRLAELWPVALWYFFDEVGLSRCPRHDGPTFRTHCPACEAAAARRDIDPGRDRTFVEEGLRFVERELAAVARTRRTGVPVAHVWGSLDLCSDGLAYARGHHSRLGGPAFRMWAERFFRPEVGGFGDLDALIARVERVIDALGEDGPLPTWFEAADRRRFVAMDLAARLLDAAVDDAGSVPADVLDRVDALAAGADPHAVAAELGDSEWDVVLATGYALGDEPPVATLARIDEGLRTVVPVALQLFDDAGLDPVPAFVAADPWVRQPLGQRFAAWVTDHAPPAVGALATWEAALRHVRADALAGLGDAGQGVALADGVVVIRAGFDVVEFAESVERGEIEGQAIDGELRVPAPAPGDDAVLLARDADGQLVIVVVPDAIAAALEHDPSSLPPDDLAELLDLQLVRRRSWSL